MDTTLIPNIEILRPGTWNGREITVADCKAVVASFSALQLRGRLPVKLGHTQDDSLPAVGWIIAVRFDGSVLYADLEPTADGKLLDEIRSGRFRFVSVELLFNASVEGKLYSCVLDGLALLGAARPAVHGLAPLNSVGLSSRAGVTVESRVALSYEWPRNDDTEVVKLRRELLMTTIEADVRARKTLPATRERFLASFGRDASLDDWKAYSAKYPAPRSNTTTQSLAPSDPTPSRFDTTSGTSSARFSALVKSIQYEAEERGTPIDYATASRVAMRRDPDLFKAYVDRKDI